MEIKFPIITPNILLEIFIREKICLEKNIESVEEV